MICENLDGLDQQHVEGPEAGQELARAPARVRERVALAVRREHEQLDRALAVAHGLEHGHARGVGAERRFRVLHVAARVHGAAARAQRGAAAHARDGALRAALRAVRALDQRRDLFFFVARPLLEVARARGRPLGRRAARAAAVAVAAEAAAEPVPAAVAPRLVVQARAAAAAADAVRVVLLVGHVGEVARRAAAAVAPPAAPAAAARLVVVAPAAAAARAGARLAVGRGGEFAGGRRGVRALDRAQRHLAHRVRLEHGGLVAAGAPWDAAAAAEEAAERRAW